MGVTRYDLAQYNIAWLKAPLDDPQMADFVANLDGINGLADSSAGFLWRFQSGENNATSTRIRDDERIIVNFSTWTDAETLFEFAFKSEHVDFVRRRNEWFTHEAAPYAVLWWVQAGHRPTVEEAEERLAMLAERGPTAEAFTFAKRFEPPEE